ncbi:DUF4252 domain-containing protein [Mesonia sp. K7]|uniref:DUF4252 domain-containing protein n=1 Tax=Mesonia sp. K7 TaxID=2218606 RepID=UPI000DA9050A|nr:DUF4252 domain-containing protein [Mesonia sp. K7]PZD79474.1 DUF4252 domain-containing protein [Mesonia sp. K7]
MKKLLVAIFISLGFVACKNEPTLQKYYVENQNNENFSIIDVPRSLVINDYTKLSAEDRKVMESIDKAVVLLLPLNGENKTMYEKEKNKVEKILQNDDYHLLMQMGSGRSGVKVSYLGDADAIDEVVVFGKDDEKGFALARILGDDMNVSAILGMMKSIGEKEIDFDESGIEAIFKSFDKGPATIRDSIVIDTIN